ncbi:MAG TPA: dihydrodipicolinate synthase family protein, partial [Woeseiaceae bacterium]|nr:dihydrodipicolinate synthase family protein [Woeseiaceae bacterium]
TGTFGLGVAELADNVRRMADTGVAAVVCLTGSLAAAEESEATWQARATALLAATGGIPLGLYECPQPYHRVLGADTLAWTGTTGRFLFLKETSARLPLIEAKIEAVRGTAEKFFNAHAATLLASLERGAHGFCGISANFVPELWTWLCRNWRDEPAPAARLQDFLRDAETAFARNYPASAKHFLAARGLPIAPVCRVDAGRPSPDDLAALADLRAAASRWRSELGVA